MAPEAVDKAQHLLVAAFLGVLKLEKALLSVQPCDLLNDNSAFRLACRGARSPSEPDFVC